MSLNLNMSHSLNRKLIVVLKLTPFIIIVTLVWLHLKINNYELNSGKSKDTSGTQSKSLSDFANKTIISNKLVEEGVKVIEQKIELINRRQQILNDQLFGPLKPNDIVIIVQVHNRAQYLSSLIKSLEQTELISDALLIFSHDVYDDQINSIVNSITFCKVMQIFYPHSLQLHPNSYPGESPNDCPRDTKKEDARKMGCINAETPDSYGHYREAKYTQTKHHWWWKINRVMDQLTVTRNHAGYFMFLEEDHYLSPDALHVWKQMNEFRIKECEKCDILTLGIYTKSVNFAKFGDKVELSKWISSRHNMGFVIDRNVWNKIKSCAQQFCSYDDYNWDWTLQYISERCLPSPLIAVVVAAPRVYHIGECGVHHKGKDCNSEEVVKTVVDVFKSSRKYLFPNELALQKGTKRPFMLPKPNGGWGDVRDHQLCIRQVDHNMTHI